MAKRVLVTGGGRGIGAAIAVECARKGAEVVVNFARNAERANGVVETIRKNGDKAIAVQADVSDRDAVVAMFERIDRDVGRIDALVNNAGTNGTVVPFVDLEMPHILEVFGTNFHGTIFCAQQAVRRMAREFGGDGGVIVNISSVAARTGGMPGHVHYAASKGAVDVLSHALAKEVGPMGIRVIGVRPGIIDTEIQDAFGGTAALMKLLPTIPVGRIGQPEDVGRLVACLVSEASSYMSGTLVDVSGGR